MKAIISKESVIAVRSEEKAAEKGEIGRSIVELSEILESAHATLELLENRITPILCGSREAKDVDSKKEIPAVSDMGGRLAALVKVARLLDERIVDITSRIAL